MLISMENIPMKMIAIMVMTRVIMKIHETEKTDHNNLDITLINQEIDNST